MITSFESVKILFHENTVIIEDNHIKLRPKEMDYFEVLFTRRDNVVLYDNLINIVYGRESCDTKAMHVIIHYLNKKINPFGIKIYSKRKRGYKLELICKNIESLKDQMVEINGMNRTVKEWCTLYGVNICTIHNNNNIGITPKEYFLKNYKKHS